MKTYNGSGCIDRVFLTSTLFGGEWLAIELQHKCLNQPRYRLAK
jgi:hypothetical protein